MKKVKIGVMSMALVGLMGSCMISHTAVVTNNNVGSKKVEVKAFSFKKDIDISYSGAMKKGDISKVGIAEFKNQYFVFASKLSVSMTGE